MVFLALKLVVCLEHLSNHKNYNLEVINLEQQLSLEDKQRLLLKLQDLGSDKPIHPVQSQLQLLEMLLVYLVHHLINRLLLVCSEVLYPTPLLLERDLVDLLQIPILSVNFFQELELLVRHSVHLLLQILLVVYLEAQPTQLLLIMVVYGVVLPPLIQLLAEVDSELLKLITIFLVTPYLLLVLVDLEQLLQIIIHSAILHFSLLLAVLSKSVGLVLLAEQLQYYQLLQRELHKIHFSHHLQNLKHQPKCQSFLA